MCSPMQCNYCLRPLLPNVIYCRTYAGEQHDRITAQPRPAHACMAPETIGLCMSDAHVPNWGLLVCADVNAVASHLKITLPLHIANDLSQHPPACSALILAPLSPLLHAAYLVTQQLQAHITCARHSHWRPICQRMWRASQALQTLLFDGLASIAAKEFTGRAWCVCTPISAQACIMEWE